MDEHVNFIPKLTGVPVRFFSDRSHGGGGHGRVTEVSWAGKSTPNTLRLMAWELLKEIPAVLLQILHRRRLGLYHRK